MCDGYRFSVRRVVEFVVALDDLSPARKGTLLAAVLGGEDFLALMSENKRREYRHLVEELRLPGPGARRPGRPSADWSEEARHVRAERAARDAAWSEVGRAS